MNHGLKLHPDGTLELTMPKGKKVGRVLVCEAGTQNGKLYYPEDVEPEIIRCKDCKHWAIGKTTKNYPNPYICELHSFMHGFERSALPEDYCSWGELRGDSDE